MAKTIIDGKKGNVKAKKRYPDIEFDKIQMYFSEPYVINLENTRGSITINIPKLGDYILVGEKKFNSTLNIFTTNTTAYRTLLWEAQIDWNTFKDFELFCMLYKQIDYDVSKLFFGEEINFQDFELVKNLDGQLILYNPILDIEINEDVYQYIAQYIRAVFNLKIEEKITKDPVLKQMFIQNDKEELEQEKLKKDKSSFSIQPLVSACVNHPGFKYNLQQVKNMSIYEFYDSVNRLNVYENTTAVLRGMYSGMIDGSHFKVDDYNFMKEI